MNKDNKLVFTSTLFEFLQRLSCTEGFESDDEFEELSIADKKLLEAYENIYRMQTDYQAGTMSYQLNDWLALKFLLPANQHEYLLLLSELICYPKNYTASLLNEVLSCLDCDLGEIKAIHEQFKRISKPIGGNCKLELDSSSTLNQFNIFMLQYVELMLFRDLATYLNYHRPQLPPTEIAIKHKAWQKLKTRMVTREELQQLPLEISSMWQRSIQPKSYRFSIGTNEFVPPNQLNQWTWDALICIETCLSVAKTVSINDFYILTSRPWFKSDKLAENRQFKQTVLKTCFAKLEPVSNENSHLMVSAIKILLTTGIHLPDKFLHNLTECVSTEDAGELAVILRNHQLLGTINAEVTIVLISKLYTRYPDNVVIMAIIGLHSLISGEIETGQNQIKYSVICLRNPGLVEDSISNAIVNTSSHIKTLVKSELKWLFKRG
ncbi:hypothetical protein HUO09_17350 [Vibrio sp. Y2-5]|uniref:hypothetical protein n=1 Tax=Vibrio sp. Y2-5 TaxID=2743977 RepID=UPI00166123A2|nr:hypothetical protein [Vibrio sp. Y2-5]MBD0788123.1 hypothetical protein [Vibrio sp. Y2-5]